VGSVQSLGKVLGLLGGKSDEEKFAGLLLVTKTVPASTRMRQFRFPLLAACLPSPRGESHADLPGHAHPPPSFVCGVQKSVAHSHSCPPKIGRDFGTDALGHMHVQPDEEGTIGRYPSHPPTLHPDPQISSPVHSTSIRSDDAQAMGPISLDTNPLNPPLPSSHLSPRTHPLDAGEIR
jgi:hypothetical protein